MSKKASKRVAAAYKGSLKGGNYGAAIAAKQAQAVERAMGAAFGAAMAAPRKSESEYGRAWGAANGGAFGSGFGSLAKRAKHTLTAAEKKARKAVQAAITNVARAARLPGKGKGKGKAAAAAPASRRRASKVPTVTADKYLKEAETKALQTWACQGIRRTGCGSKGARVVNARGSFKRIRPPRVLSAG